MKLNFLLSQPSAKSTVLRSNLWLYNSDSNLNSAHALICLIARCKKIAVPDEVISDNGPSQQYTKFAEDYVHKTSSPYHPEGSENYQALPRCLPLDTELRKLKSTVPIMVNSHHALNFETNLILTMELTTTVSR